MAQNAIANPAVSMNNIPIFIVPNSFMYTEGKGEQNVRVQSSGGGGVDPVISDNVETNKSKFSFSLFPTKQNIEIARGWKSNPGLNAMCVTADDNFNRSVNFVTLTNDYEVPLGADTTMDVEFEGAPAV